MRLRLICLLVAAACGESLAAAASDAAPAVPPAAAQSAQVALVNGRVVSRDEFERARYQAIQQKFYHRTPSADQVEEVRREVLEGLVKRSLILAEAERRSIEVDEAPIQAAIEQYEVRYAGSEAWKSNRVVTIPLLRRELAEQQRLTRLESQIRVLAEPSAAEVRAFYGANPTLFTEPERVHVSVILLKVDPSATKAVRDEAREEGRVLRQKLVDGADFAELARLRSGDDSGAKGGDLGYVHRGMLPDNLHESLDALKAGEVAAPVDVLEGVAVFKLHQRTLPKLRGFDAVKDRALELLKRERSDAAWTKLVARLRDEAVIVVDGALFPGANAGEQEPSWTAPAKSAAD